MGNSKLLAEGGGCNDGEEDQSISLKFPRSDSQQERQEVLLCKKMSTHSSLASTPPLAARPPPLIPQPSGNQSHNTSSAGDA